jgi:hypothetical protein
VFENESPDISIACKEEATRKLGPAIRTRDITGRAAKRKFDDMRLTEVPHARHAIRRVATSADTPKLEDLAHTPGDDSPILRARPPWRSQLEKATSIRPAASANRNKKKKKSYQNRQSSGPAKCHICRHSFASK